MTTTHSLHHIPHDERPSDRRDESGRVLSNLFSVATHSKLTYKSIYCISRARLVLARARFRDEHAPPASFSSLSRPPASSLDRQVHLILAHFAHRVPIRPRAKRQQRARDGDVSAPSRAVSLTERHLRAYASRAVGGRLDARAGRVEK